MTASRARSPSPSGKHTTRFRRGVALFVLRDNSAVNWQRQINALDDACHIAEGVDDHPLSQETAVSDDTGCAPAAVNRFAWERLLKASDLEPTTKLVGLVLATYANRDGTSAYPGVKRLMADCSASDKTVRRHLVKLRERGMIYRTYHASHGGVSGRSDRYILTEPPVIGEDHRSQVSGGAVTGDLRPLKTKHSSNHSARLALAHDKSRADTEQQREDNRVEATDQLTAYSLLNYGNELDRTELSRIESMAERGYPVKAIVNMVKKVIDDFESQWPSPDEVYRDWAASADCPF